MRSTHNRLLGEIGQGCGVPGGGPVVSLRGQGSGLEGSAGQVGGLLPHRGGGQGLWQAGERGGDAAQTP
jgi:hypothetical protein